MKRNLSVIGKIQVIKTFLLSQFVYVLQSILLKKEILDEINTILFRFIWKRDSIDKKAWERIKRNVLCNPKDKGGLDMIDLHAFQNSFLTEWARKLLDKEEEYWKRFAFSFYERMGGEAVFKSNVTLKKIKGLETITSPFWRAVLKTWIENNTIKQEIKRNDTICNNENITINNNVLFIEKAIKVGIIYIKDAFINGQLISFKQYEERVGKDPTNIIDYVAIKASISKVNTLITHEVSKKYYFKEYDIETINRKKIYSLMLKEETCFCEKMWENRLDRKLHCKTWQNLFTQIKETKLIQLQWKILHNIYPTNILLHKIGIKKSERCDFCEETDVVEHNFFRCERVQPFWKIVSQLIEAKL